MHAVRTRVGVRGHCIQVSRSADRNANRHVVGADFCVAPIAPKRLSARAQLRAEAREPANI